MEAWRRWIRLWVSLAIVVAFAGMVWVVADAVGAWDMVKAQMETRAAEARADELMAQAQALRERQAWLQTWALTMASLKDSALVTITYLACGLALLASVVVIGVLLYDRGGRRNDARVD